MITNVSEEYTVSIFRIEDEANQAESRVFTRSLLSLHYGPEDGGNAFLQNLSKYLPSI
jgi:hypothetical protein